MSDVKACSFTGHRQIEDPHLISLPGLWDRAINYVYGEGCRDFYLGGAVGFDTLAAQRVLIFRMTHPDVRLNLILPCINQAKGWNGEQQEMYLYILSEADNVEYVSEIYTRGCMQRRNRRLAQLCDVMIAYVSRGNSGASQTVRLATEAGKTVYNLYPHL